MAMNVPLPASIAAAALSPLVVQLLGRLLPTGSGVVGVLARANLWDARRRSASVAAPLIVLVALVAGTAAAGASFTDAGVDELRRQTRADLVVTAAGPVGPAIAAVPGVASASTELSVPVTVGSEDESSTESGLVIEPEAYARAHSVVGGLAGLRGRVVAAGPGGEVPTSGTVRLALPELDLG